MAHRPAFEETLPADYREIRRIDATVPRTGAIFNILALIPLVIAVLPVVMRYSFDDFMASPYSIHAFFLLTVSLIGYIFLHELTHGLAYKLLTGKRLTFGLSWSCAFCGVPSIYIYRRTALIACAAPFVLFTVLLVPLYVLAYLFDGALALMCAILLGLHLGGCIGDLYVCLLLLLRYRDGALLMRDTGPKQSFYLPSRTAAAEGACTSVPTDGDGLST